MSPTGPTAPPPGSDALATRRVLPWLLLLAAALRVAVLIQAAQGPPAQLHRWAESDMHFFDAWARVVQSGDVLTDRVLHPGHRWHREAAELHLSRHPEDVPALAARARDEAATAPADEPRAAADVLLDDWWGGKRFHQEPLYAYLIALVYALSGGQVLAVFVLQALLGLVAVALVFQVTRHAFGPREALCAGVLAVFCGPLLFYEVVLLRAALMADAALLLVALAQRVTHDEHAHAATTRMFVLGLAGGLATLLKTTFAPFVLLAGAWLLWRSRPPRLGRAAALACGLLLALSPAVLRNLAVGVEPLALQSVGPMTFVAFNSEHARNDLTGFFPSIEDLADIFGETGGASGPTLAATLDRQGGWTALLPRIAARAANLTHAYEAPQNVNLLFYRQMLPALAWAPVGFGLVAPLALVGFWIAARRRRGLYLALMAATSVLPLLLFSTLARYRLPLLMVLIPFAGLALSSASCWWRHRRWPTLGVAALLVAAAAWAVNRPLPEFAPAVRLDDHMGAYEADFKPRLAAAAEAADWDAALAVAEQALALEPDELAGLDAAHVPGSAAEASIAEHYLRLHELTAELALRAGDESRAGQALLRATALRAALGNGGAPQK